MAQPDRSALMALIAEYEQSLADAEREYNVALQEAMDDMRLAGRNYDAARERIKAGHMAARKLLMAEATR